MDGLYDCPAHGGLVRLSDQVLAEATVVKRGLKLLDRVMRLGVQGG